MKKTYNTPQLNLLTLCSEDVLTNSPIMVLDEGGYGDLDFFMFPG